LLKNIYNFFLFLFITNRMSYNPLNRMPYNPSNRMLSNTNRKILLIISITIIVIIIAIIIYLIISRNNNKTDTDPKNSWNSSQKDDLNNFLITKVNNINIPAIPGMTGMTGMTGMNIPLSLSSTQINNISNNIIKNYTYDDYTNVKRPLFSLTPPVPNDNQIKFQIFLFDQLKDQSVGSNNIYSQYFDWTYWEAILKDQISSSEDTCSINLVTKQYPNPLTFAYLFIILSIYYTPNPLNNNLPLQIPLTGVLTDLTNNIGTITTTCKTPPVPIAKALFGMF